MTPQRIAEQRAQRAAADKVVEALGGELQTQGSVSALILRLTKYFQIAEANAGRDPHRRLT